jgi:translocation and assembly module TamB
MEDPPPKTSGKPRRKLPLSIVMWGAGALAGLLGLVVAAALAMDTQPGRQLLIGLIERQSQPSGLRLGIARIDGSIYGRMTLRGLALSDHRGVFLTSPAVTVDWRPMELLFHRRLELDEVSADTLRLLRAPALAVTAPKPDQPTLPHIAIAIGRLHVGALVLEPAVTGDRRALSLDGRADIADGHAKVAARAQARTIDGHAGGDRLTIDLDAQPTANRLTIAAHLAAPAGGVVDRTAKLNGPATFDLDGRGDWADWRGRAVATLGGKSLIEVALTAKSGLFAAKGQADPGLAVRGPAAALTAPATAFDVSGRMTNRQIDARVRLASSALDVSASGRLDLARSAFSAFRVDGRLMKPEAVSAKLNGRDIRFAFTLDGPFDGPAVDYELKAAEVGFGKTAIEDLDADGNARFAADRSIRLPVHATASRVLGVNEAVGGLANHLRMDGDFLVNAGWIVSNDVRLRSDQLDANLVLAASLATGRYDATLKGRISRHEIKGIGLVDVDADARLVTTGRGLFDIAGHARAQFERIDDATALNLLGGNAVVSADFSRSPDGVVGIASLMLTAPKFRILDGHGRYGTDASVSFVGNAMSDRYGPLHLEVDGAADAPLVHLQAAHFDAGVPLTGLDVQAKPVMKGYSVILRGASPYGVVAADLGVTIAHGPLTMDIHRASVAGLTMLGQIQQTPMGPFAGTLKLSGDGLGGAMRLSAVGKVQRADLALRAADARVPSAPPLLIARGAVAATAILYPGAPAITGEATLTGLRRGALDVETARARIDYHAGSGHVDISADGRSSGPFSFSANADVSPDLIRVDGHGSIDCISFQLANAANIQRQGGVYRLMPATVILPQGRLELAGSYGNGATLAARLERVDLGVIEAFAPNLGVGGVASGVLDVTLPSGGALPTGHAQLTIANFTRTGPTTVSEPVDVEALGVLDQFDGNVHAVVRRRGLVIGRLQARLAPISGAASQPWLQRLRAASLTGGLRYDGPAEALWGLSGIGGQSLSGPIAIGADVSGRFDHPLVAGVLRAQSLRYENVSLGAAIDDIAIDGRFTGAHLEISKLTGKAGNGTLSGSGWADLSAANGFPVKLELLMNKAQLARSDTISATTSGSLAVTNDRTKGALVSGDLTLDTARYQIARQGPAGAAELTGVRRKGDPLVEVSTTDRAAAATGPPSVWKLDVRVHARDGIFVSGMGLEAEWRSDLHVTGDVRHPVVLGDVDLVRGTLSFAGRRLDLSRGVIHLNGTEPPNPTLDLEASSTVEDVTATIDIRGTAEKPEITFASTPTLPQDEVLSRLLFGTSVTQLSPVQAVQLAAALNSLRGGRGGPNPLGKLRQLTGIDRLGVVSADTATGQSTAVAAGKYITNKIYLEVTEDARGYTATQIEIALTKTLRLLSQASSFGGSNISLRYTHKY